jgi:hypothetical protein
MVMEYCEDSKYKWRVTIEEAFIKLEKYVVASYHNTDLSIMLHLGSLPQTSGLINLLRLVRLLHGMMMCTTAVMMCLKLGVEDDVGQVTSHLVNNTAMQFSGTFLLNYDEEDPIGRMVSMEYDADVVVDHNVSMQWCVEEEEEQCCLFSCSSRHRMFVTMSSFVFTTVTKFPLLEGAMESFCL